jgi:site-specific recombinase XerD
VSAYARDLDDYLAFCARARIAVATATTAHIARYVDDMAHRPNPRCKAIVYLHSGTGLSNSTMRRRLVVVRLFYDYLSDEGLRTTLRNPAARGTFTPGRAFGGRRARSLLPRHERLPWIPGDDEWVAILRVVALESLRNQLMFLLSYDGALRRSEIVALQVRDIGFPHRQVTIRPEIAKNRRGRVVMYGLLTRGRVVMYGLLTADLLRRYMDQRRDQAIGGGLLFRSESCRNRTQSLTVHAWDKAVQQIARAAQVPQFSTHTLRHLRLTDLARCGNDIHAIAAYAGHRSLETTKLYIRLSGGEIAERVRVSMERLDERLSILFAEAQG